MFRIQAGYEEAGAYAEGYDEYAQYPDAGGEAYGSNDYYSADDPNADYYAAEDPNADYYAAEDPNADYYAAEDPNAGYYAEDGSWVPYGDPSSYAAEDQTLQNTNGNNSVGQTWDMQVTSVYCSIIDHTHALPPSPQLRLSQSHSCPPLLAISRAVVDKPPLSTGCPTRVQK